MDPSFIKSQILGLHLLFVFWFNPSGNQQISWAEHKQTESSLDNASCLSLRQNPEKVHGLQQ